MALNPNHFKWFTPEEISIPRNGFEAVVDSWWLTNDQGQVAIYRDCSPQCNRDKRVSDIILKKGNIPGAVGMLHVPLAFIRPAPEE